MLYRGPSIRSFHDLQFDLKAMLRGLRSLEYDGSVVTMQWADGSVDKVPTAGMVKDFTGNRFPSMLVGEPETGSRLVADEGLHISTPLSVKVDTITLPSAKITSSTIANIVAQVLVLGMSVKITNLTSSGSLSTVTIKCTDGNLVVTDSLGTDVLVTRVMDTSTGTHRVARQHVISQRIATSSYVNTFQSGRFSPDIVIDGRMQTYTAVDVSRPYEEIYTYAPYVVNGQPFTMFPVMAGRNDVPEKEYPRNSLPDLALLYPYKQFGKNSNTIASLTYKAPEADLQYRVVTVRNTSKDYVRACNVWTFNQDTYAGSRRVKVSPMHYVEIPPLSAIDYIFSFYYSSNSLYAYMLPTKVLK